MNLNFDDELDLGTLESAPKTKYAKVMNIPEGRSTFRILPAPSGKKPIVEIWYNWFKFNVVGDDGEPRVISIPGRSDPALGKNNPIRTKQEAVSKRKAELESPYLETTVGANGQTSTKANEEKMPPQVLAEYKKLKMADRYLKSTRHYFAHAVTLEGEAVVLRFPKTVYDQLKKAIVDMKSTGENSNPLSLNDSTEVAEGRNTPSFGVWFDFERTGKGLETRYTTAVRKHRKKVQVDGKTLIDESYDHTSVPEDVKMNLMTNYTDLDTVITVYTNDELVEMLKGNKAPVDAKRGFSKPAATETAAAEASAPAVEDTSLEGLSLSDDEIGFDDDIPTIDL